MSVSGDEWFLSTVIDGMRFVNVATLVDAGRWLRALTPDRAG